MNKKAVLCYVKGSWAYFTTQDLEKQWGDDWDDAPYEHNAGEPYTGQDWAIVKVAFDGPFIVPGEYECNSRFSVEAINRGDIAWLRADVGEDVKPIHAGTTLEDFIRLVKEAGGEVYTKE